jgi:hypothetical protein
MLEKWASLTSSAFQAFLLAFFIVQQTSEFRLWSFQQDFQGLPGLPGLPWTS